MLGMLSAAAIGVILVVVVVVSPAPSPACTVNSSGKREELEDVGGIVCPVSPSG